MRYFSEMEAGEAPRTNTELTAAIWSGLFGLIQARVFDGSFGAEYPEICMEGGTMVGTNYNAFWGAVSVHVPELADREWVIAGEPPPTLAVMDLLQFCRRKISKPRRLSYHDYYRHYHLDFNAAAGRAEFTEEVNLILRRNRLAYELTSQGEIRRLAPPVLREALGTSVFATADPQLDTMLETARRKFLDPDEAMRREALEKLWDALERVKTVEPGSDKKARTRLLLDKVAGASGSMFRGVLEKEAGVLTDIGNDFMIRHSETTKEPLGGSDQVDYLFHRLFALIRLVLRRTGRGG
jgi:hypothetical protein